MLEEKSTSQEFREGATASVAGSPSSSVIEETVPETLKEETIGSTPKKFKASFEKVGKICIRPYLETYTK